MAINTEPTGGICVLIPIKALKKSKARLAPVLSPGERATITLLMLKDIISAVKRVGAVKVCAVVASDSHTLMEAERWGAVGLSDRGLPGMNSAIAQATDWCMRRGAEAVMVLLGDIPLVTPADIEAMIDLGEGASSVVATPSKDGGTNILLRKPPTVIPTVYGPCSFRKHRQEALKRKVPFRAYSSPTASFDVDTPEDLLKLVAANPSLHSSQFLRSIGIHARLAIAGHPRS